MNTTAVRAAIRDRIDPVLETLITRELIEQGATPSLFSGQQQQQPGGQWGQWAAIAPALIAAFTSQQQQQIPQQQQSPIASLLPILLTTLTQQQQQVPQQQPQQQIAALLPAVLPLLAGRQGQQQSPIAALASFPAQADAAHTACADRV